MAKENEEYSLEEYLEYEKLLGKLMECDSSQIVFNDSFVHAVMIVSSILAKAQTKKNSQVCMYCGKFSLFRDAARKKLESIRDSLKPESSEESKVRMWEQFNPYEKLMTKLKEYLNGGGLLSVIVENDITEIVEEDAWLKLGKFVDENKIVFKRIGVPLGLNHFVVAGNSYRRENNDEEKTALGCFNDEETSNTLKRNFQVLSLLSDDYNF